MAKLDKYLQRHASVYPLEGKAGTTKNTTVDTAVIIPALAESSSLPETLRSLARNPEHVLRRTLVIVVVNNPPVAGASDRKKESDIAQEWAADNRKTLQWLSRNAEQLPLNLAWIDKSSPGAELPRHRGVGLARKIGTDTFLDLLQDDESVQEAPSALGKIHILHLDADTQVDADYLPGAKAAFRNTDAGAVCLDFEHSPAQDQHTREIITAYELFLHYYVAGLQWAGSPYAFHTIGSTMACTASAYIRALGIPPARRGGEDFYFLQKVAKQDGVKTSAETTVHPSPRSSSRVPIGTGPHVRDQTAIRAAMDHSYNPYVFAEIKNLYDTVTEGTDMKAQDITRRLQNIELSAFLENHRFPQIWQKLQRQHSADSARLRAFHQWFDGLMIYKLIRRLTQSSLPKVELAQAWDELMAWRGRTDCVGGTITSRLQRWRNAGNRRRGGP